MEDYQRYLNAIQSAGFADNVADLKDQVEEQKKEALQPLGEMLTTGGVGHVASSAFDAFKEMAVSKAKDVARMAMKKAGVSDEDAEELLKGNFDKLARSKVNDLISKAKAKADEVKTDVEGKVDEVKADIQGKVDDLKSSVEDTVDGVKTTAQDAVDQAQSTVEDAIPQSGNDLDVVDIGDIANDVANETATSALNEGRGILSRITEPRQPDTEFGDDDLLQAPRTIQNSIDVSPRLPEAPITEDGIEMTDMTGQAESAFNQAGEVAENAISQAGEFADSALSTATTTAESIAPAVSDAVGAVSNALTGAASTLTETASGITSMASNAVSGISSAITGATAGATAGEATAEAVGTTIGSTIMEGASAFLGPLGILAAIGGGIASLVEGLAPHEAPPVLNPSAQFL